MADPQSRDPLDPPPGRSPPRAGGGDEESAGWYRMAGIGFEFIVAVALFGAAGWGLDNLFKSSPWLLLAGAGVGFAVGLWQMVRAAGKMFKN